MSHLTTIRRGAAAAGATGLIALSLAGPAAARPDPGTGGPHEWPAWSQPYQGGQGSASTTAFVAVDDNAVELLQLGAGLLAGVALAGAGMAVASRRHHAHSPV
ncbi:MAG TPA: hypothetical protein VIB11_10920 [Pedococcus sp.]|jgi:hypothetical protein|uniref:hypothetical protein n=1 Tax=Pedococcus sp. TaxID=2860345 RepID=UPI002F938BE2